MKFQLLLKPTILLLVLFHVVVSGLYEEAFEDEVLIPINDMDDLQELVIDSDHVWAVQFYSSESECVECVQYEDLMTTVGQITKGIFKIGVVDISTDGGKEIAYKYKYKKIPTIAFFAEDKHKPTRYKGQHHDIQKILETVSQHMVETIQTRINDAGMGTGDNNNKKQPNNHRQRENQEKREKVKPTKKKEKKKEQEKIKLSKDTKVVSLNADNFEEFVLQTNLVSAIAFTSPTCGHCRQLLPEWEDAARKLDGEGAILGWVDATVEEELAATFSVQGFPTIITFDGGNPQKTYKDAKPYNSDRSSSIIVQHMLRMVDNSPQPQMMGMNIPELINDDQFNEYCRGTKSRICVLAAFPHLLDTGAKGRSKYLSVLYDTYRQSFRGTAFKFAWFEGGNQQYKFEEALDLTFGFPAVVAISLEKQAYAVMTGSFNPKAIASFLHAIEAGSKSIIPLGQKLPKFKTVDNPWDGISDGEPIEEEMSLDDIMGGDDEDEDEDNDDNNDNDYDDDADLYDGEL